MNLYYMINECYNKYYDVVTIEERKIDIILMIFDKFKKFNSCLYF